MQLIELGDIYYTHQTPDIASIVHALQTLNKSVYVISAGIHLAVQNFATQLNIPSDNIFGVDVYFDDNGDYRDYDHYSPMTRQHGKCEIIKQIKQQHPHVIHVGDGMNDVEAAVVVDRFIGYGGSYFRQNIAMLCDFYITSQSMTPVLPLILTESESKQLAPSESSFYKKGMDLIKDGKVLLKAE